MLKWHVTNISGNKFPSFSFYCYLLSRVANIAANYICIKYMSKASGWKEISNVGVTWYMGRTYVECTSLLGYPRFNHLLDRTLGKFTQLKRNKRFDNFIMFVGVQGLLFHIAAGSHPVQKACRSQDAGHNMLHIAKYSEFELYLPDEHVETIAGKIEAFLPVWSL